MGPRTESVEEWTPPPGIQLWRWAFLISAFAAVALLLLAATFYRENRELHAAARTAEVDTTVQRARERELERRLDRYHAALRDFSAPGAVEVRFARGLTAGRMAIHAEGVAMAAWDFPPPPRDRIYGLWLFPAGSPAPIAGGVFVPDENGNVLHTWKLKVDAAAIKSISITDEPPGGGPLPTGGVFLTSPVKK